VRGHIGVVCAGLLVLTGCGSEAVALPEPVVVTDVPAATAGGVCELLDMPTIAKVTGTRFIISATSKHRKTRTCVMQTGTASRPDLALSVTPTSADAQIFADEMRPQGAKTVKGLGKSAYWRTLAAGKGYGAGVEVGWLSRSKRLMCLRYQFAKGQDTEAAEALAPKLVALAKSVESPRS